MCVLKIATPFLVVQPEADRQAASTLRPLHLMMSTGDHLFCRLLLLLLAATTFSDSFERFTLTKTHTQSESGLTIFI